MPAINRFTVLAGERNQNLESSIRNRPMLLAGKHNLKPEKHGLETVGARLPAIGCAAVVNYQPDRDNVVMSAAF
ncbi:hypothetical protein [Pseudomonas sp.]|uniref:hypothetical protein n=1 Tax=Pseudomonas sp. TaxID=306 RepID=UPI002637C626|nr:hypothetical protein [Pseudomonas sp.]